MITLTAADPLLTAPKRTFVNLRRADWEGFEAEIEEKIASSPIPSSVSKGESTLRQAILKAAKHHIPAGRRPKFQPCLPPEAVKMAKERDHLRETDPANPQITTLNSQISTLSNITRKSPMAEVCHRKLRP